MKSKIRPAVGKWKAAGRCLFLLARADFLKEKDPEAGDCQNNKEGGDSVGITIP